MVAAPIAMPQIARELFGVDPSSAEFRERYAEATPPHHRLPVGDPRGHAHASGPARSSNGQPSDTQPPNTQPSDIQPSDTQPIP